MRGMDIAVRVLDIFMSTRTLELKRKAAFVIAVVLTLAVAQLGSYLVDSHLPIGETYIVNSVIHLTHVRNTGGVFGSFEGNGASLAMLAAALLIGISVYLLRDRTVDLFDVICIGFWVGAGASNILDRLLYGGVVDFIDIQGIPHWHYIFNTADAMIHLGVWPFVIRHLFVRGHPRSAVTS